MVGRYGAGVVASIKTSFIASDFEGSDGNGATYTQDCVAGDSFFSRRVSLQSAGQLSSNSFLEGQIKAFRHPGTGHVRASLPAPGIRARPARNVLHVSGGRLPLPVA